MSESWPGSSDYNESIQDPASCFQDPELKAAEVACTPMGLPQVYAGNFADVYELRRQDGKRRWAVKCFTRRVKGQTERYQEISRHLSGAKLALTVNFQFLENGIRIRGKWYPVLKMDWVSGQTLRQIVEENLGNPAMLEPMREVWLKVGPLLRKASVAHGDLQHGNILFIPGSRRDSVALRLVDYDGMWTPGLAQRKSGEVGHPNYQHPQRSRDSVYSADVDRFPDLVIAASLHTLLHHDDLDLWTRYDNGENLLFQQTDFQAPARSKLIQELWDTGDPQTQAWVGQIVSAAQKPLSQTPPLSELVDDGGEIGELTASDRRAAQSTLGKPLTVPVPSVIEFRIPRSLGRLWASTAPTGNWSRIWPRSLIILALIAIGLWFLFSGAAAAPVKPLRTYTSPSGMELVVLHAGEFWMGSIVFDIYPDSDERPQHRVQFTRPVAIGKYEVTREQFARYLADADYSRSNRARKWVPSEWKPGEEKLPIANVSWNEAVEYCNWLSEQEGLRPCYERSAGSYALIDGDGYRLPTEAEWECACRAGTLSRFCNGDDLDRLSGYGNYRGTIRLSGTEPLRAVGSLSPNAFGLYDMHGNVEEWCQDWYDEHYYRSSPVQDPPGPATGTERVTRGGGFSDRSTNCRSANRKYVSPDSGPHHIGFRIARTESP